LCGVCVDAHHGVVAFRDAFEQCPRCGTALIDARAARGCTSCGGLWIEEPVLTEMVLEMLPVPPAMLSRLQLAVLARGGEAIGCPTCGEAMHPTTIHEVVLDRCAKHGVWFDRDELAVALQRVGDPARTPPLVEREPAPAPPRRASPPMPPTTAAAREPDACTTTLRVVPRGGDAYDVVVQRAVIKVGKLASAHVRIDDEAASRMHAVIEVVSPGEVTLIDLGSTRGTRVNGERITKASLRAGDLIEVGDTQIALVSVA